MKNYLLALLAALPVTNIVSAVLGYWFGPKAVEYVSGAVSKVYGDVKASVAKVLAKL